MTSAPSHRVPPHPVPDLFSPATPADTGSPPEPEPGVDPADVTPDARRRARHRRGEGDTGADPDVEVDAGPGTETGGRRRASEPPAGPGTLPGDVTPAWVDVGQFRTDGEPVPQPRIEAPSWLPTGTPAPDVPRARTAPEVPSLPVPEFTAPEVHLPDVDRDVTVPVRGRRHADPAPEAAGPPPAGRGGLEPAAAEARTRNVVLPPLPRREPGSLFDDGGPEPRPLDPLPRRLGARDGGDPAGAGTSGRRARATASPQAPAADEAAGAGRSGDAAVLFGDADPPGGVGRADAAARPGPAAVPVDPPARRDDTSDLFGGGPVEAPGTPTATPDGPGTPLAPPSRPLGSGPAPGTDPGGPVTEPVLMSGRLPAVSPGTGSWPARGPRPPAQPGQPGTGKPGTGQYPAQPGTGLPGAGQHPGQPGTGQHPAQPGAGQPAAGPQPAAGRPGGGQPGSGNDHQPPQPGTGQYPAQPGAGQPPAQPGTGQHPAQPGSGQPGTGQYPTQPGTGQHPAQPGSGQLGTGQHPTQPGTGQHPAQPGSGQPGSGQYPVQPGAGQLPAHPGTGQYPVQPATGQHPAQPGPVWPPAHPGTGQYPVQPGTGQYPAQPQAPGPLPAGASAASAPAAPPPTAGPNPTLVGPPLFPPPGGPVPPRAHPGPFGPPPFGGPPRPPEPSAREVRREARRAARAARADAGDARAGAAAQPSGREGGLGSRLGGDGPHGDGVARRAFRFAAHLVTTTAATRELAELAEATQAPVTTGRRIAVISVRGGAGRSTVTALLGSVFAARRADHILVADADPDHGSLAWRLGLSGSAGLSALGPRLLAARGGVAELDTILSRTPAGLRLLPGADGAPAGATREVTRALSRFFAICVTDCGRGLESQATAEVLADAHAAVIVTPATQDGVRTTLAGLERMPPNLRQRVVVALSTTDRGGRAALAVGVAREALADVAAHVVTLPYDRHLAAGAAIVPGRLAEATLIEATRLSGYALALAGQT